MRNLAFAVALLAATPAFADHDTDRRVWVDRWQKCVNSYVEAYPGHCADVVDRAERKNRDRTSGGHFRRHRDHRYTKQSIRQWCWNNPAYCADGEPRSYGRR